MPLKIVDPIYLFLCPYPPIVFLLRKHTEREAERNREKQRETEREGVGNAKSKKKTKNTLRMVNGFVLDVTGDNLGFGQYFWCCGKKKRLQG